jgi:signal transduction histidine kinase
MQHNAEPIGPIRFHNTSIVLRLTVMALITLAYFAAGKIGLGFASVHVSATPLWAPAGMAVAVFLLFGFTLWPIILVGAFLVNITTAGTVLTSSCIAVGNTLEGLLGALLVQRYAHGLRAFESPVDVFKFAMLGGLLSPIVSATIGTTSLAWSSYALSEQYASIWLTWWLGDAAGIIIITPTLILWAQHPRVEWSTSERIELALLVLVLFATCETIFGAFLGTEKQYPLQFLLVPILIWAAFRFSPRETATLSVLLAAWAAWGTMNGRGPFTSQSENDALLFGQAFLGVNTVMALALAAGVQERMKAGALLKDSREEVKESRAKLQDFANRLEHRVKERTEELLHSQAQLRVMARELTLTEQRERNRMATELHDHLQQMLVLGKLKLRQARQLAHSIPACAEAIRETDGLLSDSLMYTRTLVAELSPPVLRQFGFLAGLKWLGDYMKKHDIVVTVVVPDDSDVTLPEDQAVLLFQSVRELLINSAKHSGSHEASVTLKQHSGELQIEVRDYGAGWDPAPYVATPVGDGLSSKFGLFSIRERMKALGGSLDIETSPGHGTIARLRLPQPHVPPATG